ncbi:DUF5957 family protein [Pseudonocardia sp. TRM90224]|uniref:DUF5957 family protein n=1 Tax=Pseudonocardia sp. TRM90224 TaxID=2812678 RepID=UPI001E42FB66|nr:DUF5957 family protein [Pseudonocardia sp. TRM90224]
MRTLGIAVLGLFSGLLLGFVLTDVIAVAAGAASGKLPDSLWLLLLLGWLTPGCAVVGVVVAITIDRKRRAR